MYLIAITLPIISKILFFVFQQLIKKFDRFEKLLNALRKQYQHKDQIKLI